MMRLTPSQEQAEQRSKRIIACTPDTTIGQMRYPDQNRFAIKVQIDCGLYYYGGRNIHGDDFYCSSEEKQYSNESDAISDAARLGGFVVPLAEWRWR